MHCLDTYALIEIYNGAEAYKKITHSDFVITDWTLTEFYWVLLRTAGEDVADYHFNLLVPYTEEVSWNVLREAMKFRYKHRKQKLAYFDCIGYVYAKHKSLNFVTGDKEFSKFSDVKFIK